MLDFSYPKKVNKQTMHGWTGKILRIDLSAGTHSVERPSLDVYRKYVGGRGLAGYYLRDRVTLPWDDPDMPILIFTGPLNATRAPTSGRACILSRSPLTGTMTDSSVGGSLGTRLKKAGWDGIVITGKGAHLRGIEIKNGSVAVQDASGLAGLGTGEMFARLKQKGSVAAVGPAAENRVRFANVMVDGRFAAGRGGLGLCFAAKNLKYVTVQGDSKVRVHDAKALEAAREEIFRLTAASPVLKGGQGISRFGTPALLDLLHSRRMMPTDNFRHTYFEPAPSLNAHALKQKYKSKRHGCKGCHILCKRAAPDGLGMPEFETLSHFTALIGNTDMDLVVKANALCNQYGMDSISAGATLACHREITGEELPPKRVLSLLEDMGKGKGLGKELGQGSRQYASNKDRPDASMSVKGLELPAYDPRGAYGMALAYGVSTRGGCHLRAYPISHEILRKPVVTDRFSFSGKARIIKIAEDQNAVVDSLIACKFIFFAATLEEYAKAFTAVTGLKSSAQDLLRVGERICFLERIMNAQNGFCAGRDDLPRRFFQEPGSHGQNIEVPPLDRKEFLEARARYYKV
ncbi:MAG: aldehyde ferredoxin oxidoreductase family protein, partial [Thermodesulfobacteriota bacterium]|nr:aldehyde ferredoxin oxidoreductase family protein [Thermodesulfobacteriota bacterium]